MKRTVTVATAMMLLMAAGCGSEEQAAPSADATSSPAASDAAPNPQAPSASEAGANGTSQPAVYTATGKVTAVSNNGLTIAHGPVEGLGWPAMTMAFRAESSGLTQGLQPGSQVRFSFRQDGSSYVLTSVEPVR